MIAKQIIGALDILGAFVLIWAAVKITSKAGFRDKIARWALLRKIAYMMAIFSLFFVGITQLTGKNPSDWLEVAAHAQLLFYIIVFPLLRALGWITQDMLTSDWDRRT